MTKQSNIRNFSIIAHIDRVGAKSACLRFRLAAKAASTPLRLLSPQNL